MITIISYIYVLLVVVLWFYFFTKSKVDALCFLILSEVIYINYSSPLNVDFIIKILILITDGFSLLEYGFRKKNKSTIIFLIALFFIGMLGAKFDSLYTFKDNLLAYLSTFIGFLTLSINWPTNERKRVLKKISYIPIFSIVIGALLIPLKIVPFFTRTGNIGVGGASMATNLSFFGVVGIIASLVLHKYTLNDKYRYLAYINLFIVFLTLTRGGLLAGIIALLPDITKWLKEMYRYKKKLMISFFVIAASIYPLLKIGNLLIQRSFVDGEFSTSGRIDAWLYIVRLIRNNFYGNGFGYLKTVTDSSLRSFTAAHNEYVRVYLETGIIGLLMHFIMFLKNFKSIIQNTIINKSYVICFILSFLVYSITDNTITNYRFWIPFVFVMALIGSANYEKNI